MSQKNPNVSDIMYIMQSEGHNIPSVVFLTKTHNLNLTMNIRQIQIRRDNPQNNCPGVLWSVKIRKDKERIKNCERWQKMKEDEGNMTSKWNMGSWVCLILEQEKNEKMTKSEEALRLVNMAASMSSSWFWSLYYGYTKSEHLEELGEAYKNTVCTIRATFSRLKL